jgi:hypothetical protein
MAKTRAKKSKGATKPKAAKKRKGAVKRKTAKKKASKAAKKAIDPFPGGDHWPRKSK